MRPSCAFDFCSLIEQALELMLRGNVFGHRPKLGKWDWLVLAGGSLTM